LNELEIEIASRLRLQKVIIVAGDSDTDEAVKKEIARATAKYLYQVLNDGDVLAVTGGTTLAEVAVSFPNFSSPRNVTVVPARGGLGENVEIQANTIAAEIAKALGGNYRLLHVPDDLGEEALATICEEPKIRELLQLIRSSRIVLHGIGSAEEMAKRRAVSEEVTEMLRQRRAVGEAFGYYFDETGTIVHASGSVGLRYEDLGAAGEVIAVGGGKSKAAAALAVLVSHHQDTWITDEGAARQILLELSKNHM
jgi:central glycolytic genes regulator